MGMRELFKDCPNSNGLRIEQMNKIIHSKVVGDIKLYPILILNVDKLLMPSKLIQFVLHQTRNENESKLKMVQSFMMKSGELMHRIIEAFKGRVVILSNHSYFRWDDLVQHLPSICGG